MKKEKFEGYPIFFIIIFFLIILGLTILMTVKNTADLRGILYESVKSQLISISVAARELIDTDKFDSYNGLQDIENDSEAYERMLSDLTELQKAVGATYIYALKYLADGKSYFIFDTDPEDPRVFIEYELSPVHKLAFVGQETAGVLNVVDEWGSYNTGAVPIIKDGIVIGIVSTDIEDDYMKKSEGAAIVNTLLMVAAMVVTMSVMVYVIILLLRRLKHIREQYYRMANYDTITGLPNRRYLMNYLESISKWPDNQENYFALMLIDLDNFKSVNDNAGHDAGDQVLCNVAEYLKRMEEMHAKTKSFHPSAGVLNISARLGGDEFVQIVREVRTEREAEIVAKKLLDNFNTPEIAYFIEKYNLGMSIGVALFPYHSTNYHVLIKYADIAMYHAKESGKHDHKIFDFEMGPKNRGG